MSTGKGLGAGMNADWPADVIHVNEDGWVLINRGAQHGIPVGLRLLVVGAGARELRDLFSAGAEMPATPSSEGGGDQETEGTQQDGTQMDGTQMDEPVVLRTRRTYELLEVVHVEPACAIAIAARTPADRRPQFYRGPEGDLLVWVPLPANFTYPRPDSEQDEEEFEEEEAGDEDEGEAEDNAQIDMPPQRADQEDERWEEALPLNGVGVGDQVVPAMPANTMTGAPSQSGKGRTATSPGSQPAGEPPLTQFEQGRSYDWMKPQS